MARRRLRHRGGGVPARPLRRAREADRRSVWVPARRCVDPSPVRAQPRRGRRLFLQSGCTGCRLDGAPVDAPARRRRCGFLALARDGQGVRRRRDPGRGHSHPPGGARLGGSSRRRARRGRRAPVDRTSRLGRAFRHGGRARRVPGGRRSPRARARSSAGVVGVRGAGRPGAAGGLPSHPPLRPRSYGNAPPGCGIRARDGHDRGARGAVQLVDRGHVVSRHGRGQGRRRARRLARRRQRAGGPHVDLAPRSFQGSS